MGEEAERFRLFHRGRLLADEKLIDDYNLKEGEILHLNVSRAAPGTSGSVQESSNSLDEQEKMLHSFAQIPGVRVRSSDEFLNCFRP